MSVHVPTPKWPSLYDPLIEFHNWQHHEPIQPKGHYIYKANDVFRYTFYWTLIFHAPFFLFSGALAFFNIVYPAHRPALTHAKAPSTPSPPIPLTPLSAARSPDLLLAHSPRPDADADAQRPTAPPRNVHRSRLTLALLTLTVFLVAAVGTALIESVVVGYLLVAVFRAGHFNISTLVPPIWALIITSAEVLGVFPTVIDRI
ncbi:hypothetical protein FA95DRAFT_1009112 [Auriscalpium vulgare]|uniref:Uncharacterized protein n=1 Tax=Auriscalpium vulgare TaxID=40419 RepID=A0ACB8RY70_9AGAM|nr:hypothetical protein FA95DRAFT_1009112 [Auriscalpium vulgare]